MGFCPGRRSIILPIAKREIAMQNDSTIESFLARQRQAGKRPNALIEAKSPYLLQHAFQPVAWLPWGEEAFTRARSEDKPIFLSIGYSTCHWCHVMAAESFSDPELAATLNQDFVPVKLDREERPDIDHIYMTAVQALTGQGGWPLSVFLTPDLKPIYGGSYFPPQPRHGLPGFAQVLAAVLDAWRNRRFQLMESSRRLLARLGEEAAGEEEVAAGDLADRAYARMVADFDARDGGFGREPKFPRPVLFNFLLRHGWKNQGVREQAWAMTFFTLRKMAGGGIYDQIGGGFHRYAVDRRWQTPHFEKMLYDQAQLALTFLEAFQVGQDPFYAEVAQDILAYALRELLSPEGGFYSAEDADSAEAGNPARHGEGLFYLWSRGELVSVLGEEAGEVFAFHYGAEEGGNVQEDPHGDFAGKNILHVAHPLEETAARFHKSEAELATLLERARQKLFLVRKKRPKPHLDDKIITSWNGLMLGALARAARILGEKRYLDAAERLARFLRARLYLPGERRLLRRFRAGEAGVSGQLDDYAFLANGLLELYEASFAGEWLEWAVELTERQIVLFGDRKGGGFFDTDGNDPSVLLRLKSDYDGAEPTGNSLAAANLIRLSWVTGREEWRRLAAGTVAAFAERLRDYPASLPQLLVAHALLADSPRQLVLAGKLGRPDTELLLSVLRKRFLPNVLLLLADGGEGEEFLRRQQRAEADLSMREKRATLYFCEDYRCRPPITELAELMKLLDSLAPDGG